MTEQLDRLIDELIDRPAMLAKEFAAALNAALRSGEKVGDPIQGNRVGDSFLHRLAKIAPKRADLLLEATRDPMSDLNSVNSYGQRFSDVLTDEFAYNSLLELVDADRPIEIDSPNNRVSRHETPYRMAVTDGPYQLVASLHDYSDRMREKGSDVGRVFPERLNRFGRSVLHDFAGRNDLSPDDMAGYLSDLQSSLGLPPSDLKELLEGRDQRGQTFFNRLVSRDPALALATHFELSKTVDAEMYDPVNALRGNPELSIAERNLSLPEQTIPALQLSSMKGEGAEQLMNAIVAAVNPRDLQVRSHDGGETPLSIMARKGFVDALSTALDRGLDVNYGAGGLTKNPLAEAINNSARTDLAYAAVKRLMSEDIDSRWLETRSSMAPSAVQFAVDHGDASLVARTLLQGGDPNGHPAANYSPLRSSIENYSRDPVAHEKILNHLIFNGASLKKVDADMLSPSARLSQPDMAAARDYVHRLTVINQLSDRYGFEYAAAAVDGFTKSQTWESEPNASLGTLQMIPGVSRALADMIAHEPTKGEAVKAMLMVSPQTDPEISALDLVDSSRTLLSIPRGNRETMCVEIAKIRSAMAGLGPEQLSPQAINAYQDQIMAANRLFSWVSESRELQDTPQDAMKLTATHGRHLQRSMIKFADAIAASPLTLNPNLSDFPMALGNDGAWEAQVDLAGSSHPAPRPGKPISFLYGVRADGTSRPRVETNVDNVDVLTYIPSISDLGVDSGATAGYVSFSNPTVIFAEDPMKTPFNVDTNLLVGMGHDGAIIYDVKNARVAGAMDFEGRRLEVPAGVTVMPNTGNSAAGYSIMDEYDDRPAPPTRTLGM